MKVRVIFDDIEARFRELLPSVERYAMRPLSNDLVVSFGAKRDFFSAIRSASGVNIAVETGWMFEKHDAVRDVVAHCYLRFQLVDGCLDERLTFFLDDLSVQGGMRAGVATPGSLPGFP